MNSQEYEMGFQDGKDQAKRDYRSILLFMVVVTAFCVITVTATFWVGYGWYGVVQPRNTTTQPSTAIQQPATSGTKSQYDFSKDDFTAELKALRKFEPEEAGTEKKE